MDWSKSATRIANAQKRLKDKAALLAKTKKTVALRSPESDPIRTLPGGVEADAEEREEIDLGARSRIRPKDGGINKGQESSKEEWVKGQLDDIILESNTLDIPDQEPEPSAISVTGAAPTFEKGSAICQKLTNLLAVSSSALQGLWSRFTKETKPRGRKGRHPSTGPCRAQGGPQETLAGVRSWQRCQRAER